MRKLSFSMATCEAMAEEPESIHDNLKAVTNTKKTDLFVLLFIRCKLHRF